VGAGTGVFTSLLASHCRNITAVDRNPKHVDELKRMNPSVAIVLETCGDGRLAKAVRR
jgi:16S rRNA A1518/A1519 N6-dimethyltransferase RsmA/KsgA/DIM1 with predicted DNA glycosylase/AP lyase activity